MNESFYEVAKVSIPWYLISYYNGKLRNSQNNDISFYFNFKQIYGFSNFHLGTIETVSRYKGPVYLYLYDHDNKYAYLKTYLELLATRTKAKLGKFFWKTEIFKLVNFVNQKNSLNINRGCTRWRISQLILQSPPLPTRFGWRWSRSIRSSG